MRAAIYIRVSTEDQVKHGYSLAEQKESCRKRADSLKASVVGIYSDEGISGSILERPGLLDLREEIRNGRVDIVIVRDPDRLSRKLSHQLLLTEEFEKAGVKLEFLDFDWKNTPEGRLFYSIRGAISEFEREKIRDRMTRGKNQKAKQGGLPMGFYAYGYDQTEDGVNINIYESEIINKIFNWFINEDIGMNGIANRLNAECVPTKKKRGRWHRNVIRQILKNSVYKGKWKYKDIIIPVPSIIDEETWTRAQDKLKEARRLWSNQSRSNYLVSGIISCMDCGNTMTGVYASWWGDKIRRYTCLKTGQAAKNTGCVPMKSISADIIERTVWEQVCSWLDNPDALAQEIIADVPRDEELQKELGRIQKHIADIEKGQEALLDALASGLFVLNEKTKAKLLVTKRNRERMELRKGEIETMLNKNARNTARIEEIKEYASEILAKLDNLEFAEKKSIVRSLVSQVMLSGRVKRGPKGDADIKITIVAKVSETEILFPYLNSPPYA